jgi:hypothetical protein
MDFQATRKNGFNFEGVHSASTRGTINDRYGSHEISFTIAYRIELMNPIINNRLLMNGRLSFSLTVLHTNSYQVAFNSTHYIL